VPPSDCNAELNTNGRACMAVSHLQSTCAGICHSDEDCMEFLEILCAAKFLELSEGHVTYV